MRMVSILHRIITNHKSQCGRMNSARGTATRTQLHAHSFSCGCCDRSYTCTAYTHMLIAQRNVASSSTGTPCSIVHPALYVFEKSGPCVPVWGASIVLPIIPPPPHTHSPTPPRNRPAHQDLFKLNTYWQSRGAMACPMFCTGVTPYSLSCMRCLHLTVFT